MTVLITGGTGPLGRQLAAALLARGTQVRLLGRSFRDCAGLLAAGAEPLALDLRDQDAVVAACANTRLVYHAGALSAPWGRRADFVAVNIGGTAAIVAGCLKHGATRLVYVSSPSVVFDGRDQQMLTEAAPYPRRFASLYSWSKKRGEDLVNAAAQHGLETVIVRPKAIFGPNDQALLPRLVAAARSGRLPLVGDGRNLVDLTYIDNVVAALLLAGLSPAACGKTYTITNGEPVALWGVVRELLRRLGLNDQLRRVPLGAALTLATLMEARATFSGREPLLTRYSVLLLARTQTYSIAAARRDLGYEPGVSLRSGIEYTLASLQ